MHQYLSFKVIFAILFASNAFVHSAPAGPVSTRAPLRAITTIKAATTTRAAAIPFSTSSLVTTSVTPTSTLSSTATPTDLSSTTEALPTESSAIQPLVPVTISSSAIASTPSTISAASSPQSPSNSDQSNLKMYSIIVATSCFLIGLLFFLFYIRRRAAARKNQELDIQSTAQVVKGVFKVGSGEGGVKSACSFENLTTTDPLRSVGSFGSVTNYEGQVQQSDERASYIPMQSPVLSQKGSVVSSRSSDNGGDQFDTDFLFPKQSPQVHSKRFSFEKRGSGLFTVRE